MRPRTGYSGDWGSRPSVTQTAWWSTGGRCERCTVLQRLRITMRLAHLSLDRSAPPLVIAEMSGNHNQSLDRALAIVDAAAAAGAHALKLQTYTADTMTLDIREREFFISDPNSLWKGNSLFELYQKAHTPWEWHKR